MTYGKVYLTAAIVLAVIMMLSGCAGVSKPSKFYLLLTIPEAEGPIPFKEDSNSLSVMVGPISLAAYLERDQIVQRTSGNEMTIDDFARWGEPLQDNFYRVLIDNLSFLLNTPEIFPFDRREAFPADLQVVIDVIRFDRGINGDAYMTAFWSVAGEDGRTNLLYKKSVFQVRPSSSGVAGLVKAQNKIVAEFSREIAAAIQSLEI